MNENEADQGDDNELMKSSQICYKISAKQIAHGAWFHYPSRSFDMVRFSLDITKPNLSSISIGNYHGRDLW